MIKTFIERKQMKIGYARVSTTDQDLTGQLDKLAAEGCEKVFREKASGADGDRAELASALEFVRSGDCLIVTKLDRLARSMVDFWNIVKAVEGKGASLQVLNMGLDTASSQGRLMMGVLSSVAEFERSLIRERQQDGIEKAKGQGKHLGRPSLDGTLKAEVIAFINAGNSKPQAAERFNIGVSTVYKLVKG